jgi:hypothetical protein
MPYSHHDILVVMLAKCDQILATTEELLTVSSEDDDREKGRQALEAAKELQRRVEAGIRHLGLIG